jgi:signal transduction histidine kinase
VPRIAAENNSYLPGQERLLLQALVGGTIWLLLSAAVAGLLARFLPGLPLYSSVLVPVLTTVFLGVPFLYLLGRRLFNPSRPERKAAETSLEVEQRRLFSLLDELPAIVYLKGSDYSIRFANHHFRTRFGDPNGQLCYQRIHRRETPCEFCSTESVLQNRQPIEREQVYPDGAIYQLYDIPFRDANDAELVLQLGIDVTRRKQVEAELERTNQELLALSQAERTQRLFAEGLAQAALALNSSLDLDEVLDAILERTQQVIPCHGAALMLCQGTHISLARHRGIEGTPQVEALLKPGLPLDDLPVLKAACRDRKLMLIADVRLAPRWRSISGLEWVRSFAAVPLTQENHVVGLIALLSDQVDFFSQPSIDQLQVFAAHAELAFQNARLYEEMRASRQELQALSRRLVGVQEEERRSIARELHDEAGQALTLLRVELEVLERKVDDPQQVILGTTQLKQIVEEIMQNLHRLAVNLRPASLDQLGLAAALHQHGASVSAAHHVEVQVEALNLDDRLPADLEVTLYRIVQESLNNVVRHAGARHADVILERRDGRVIAVIEDDGYGFDPEAVRQTDRLGLLGMRERAEALGGTLIVDSAPGSGTTVRVEVPVGHTSPDR